LTTLEGVRGRAEGDAKSHGYYLNPDGKFLSDLLEGLKENEERYGYPSCPCRLASGRFEFDRDIICPCDYRDPDVDEYGCCYCALYVRKDVYEGKTPTRPIPERRPLERQNRVYAVSAGPLAREPSQRKAISTEAASKTRMKLFYCRQCGYVCFREEPPYVCPICRAKREMFSEIQIRAVSTW